MQPNENSPSISDESYDPIHDIIDFLIHNENVPFKSQQIGEDRLKKEEKRTIAFNSFQKSPSSFLEKYGRYLKLEHLAYFENCKQEQNQYELNYHIANLKLHLNDNKNKAIVKNRRFEALSRMLEEGSYFSETEMMHRNPLLYEQLVGQYMSENEKIARDDIDLDKITLLNVLLEGIDRKNVKSLRDKQKSSEVMESKNDDPRIKEKTKKPPKWGEFDDHSESSQENDDMEEEVTPISAPERELLREEFVQEMYRSFLAGEDEDFDYKTIDENSDYDCIVVRGRDEEENYFDSESPDQISTKSEENKTKNNSNNESEDELDIYMKHLNQHPSVCNST